MNNKKGIRKKKVKKIFLTEPGLDLFCFCFDSCLTSR